MSQEINLPKSAVKSHDIYTEIKDGKLYILSICEVQNLNSRCSKVIDLKEILCGC